ncbi:MAG: Ig-like domain-containing protein [Eubacteriales bacterium]
MAQIKCEYCGTVFDPDVGICPLCGIPEEMEAYSHPVAPVAPPVAPTPVQAPRPQQPVTPHQPREAERRAAAKSSKSSRKRKSGQRKEDKVPAWISVTICGVLTIAVVLGGGIALLQTDIFKVSEELEEALSLPYESEVVETTTEVPEDVIVVNPDVECTSLSLNYNEVTLFEQGEQLTLTAITEPSSAASDVTWVSGDESIVTVSTTGVITAISGGSTTVTAICGDQMATSEVRCGFEAASIQEETTTTPTVTEDVDVENFTARLNLTDFTLFEAGETAQLTVSGAPSSLTVDWSIANSGVATIDSTGLVTAVKTGTTKVTAKVGDQILECYVRCNITGSGGSSSTDGTGSTASVAASISHEDVTLSVGESFTISVTGSTTANTFTSSNSGVCTISGGTVTATGSGTAKVTTEVNGETLTCVVRVP